jgi:hypothetical protein
MDENSPGIATITDEVESLRERLSLRCAKIAVVGEIRRRCPVVREIKFLTVPENSTKGCVMEEQLNLSKNEGIVRRSGNGYALSLTRSLIPVSVIQTTEDAWPAMLFHHTASKDLTIAVATVAKAMGLRWIPERGGFFSRESNQRVRRMVSERDVFDFTRIPYMSPELCVGGPIFQMKESEKSLPMSMDEVREFVKNCVWIETRLGGELHAYTLRVLTEDELSFVHLVETIREYGYDGRYLGKAYRYLDENGFQYFTQGYDMRVTTLINRKKLNRADMQRSRNPVAFKPLPDSFGRLP